MTNSQNPTPEEFVAQYAAALNAPAPEPTFARDGAALAIPPDTEISCYVYTFEDEPARPSDFTCMATLRQGKGEGNVSTLYATGMFANALASWAEGRRSPAPLAAPKKAIPPGAADVVAGRLGKALDLIAAGAGVPASDIKDAALAALGGGQPLNGALLAALRESYPDAFPAPAEPDQRSSDAPPAPAEPERADSGGITPTPGAPT